jgi:hypothetical protein
MKGSMHGQSTALQDPSCRLLQMTVGDQGRRYYETGKYPGCLVPFTGRGLGQKAAVANPAYSEGVTCTTAHVADL